MFTMAEDGGLSSQELERRLPLPGAPGYEHLEPEDFKYTVERNQGALVKV